LYDFPRTEVLFALVTGGSRGMDPRSAGGRRRAARRPLLGV